MFTWNCNLYASLLQAFLYPAVKFSQESHSGDWGDKADEVAYDVDCRSSASP